MKLSKTVYTTVLFILAISSCINKPIAPTLAIVETATGKSTLIPTVSETPTPFRIATTEAVSPSPSPSVSPSPTVQTSPRMVMAQLQMFDTNTGWAVYSNPFFRPEDSKILRTADGIQTWMDVTPPISESSSKIRAVFFRDVNTAIVISSHSFLPVSPTVEIIPWRTTDGGQTWQAGKILKIDYDFYPSQLIFLNQEQGWMLGESDSGMGNMRVQLLETQDGGMHWEVLYDTVNHLSDPDTLWISGYYPFSEHFTFVSETVGFFSNKRLFSSQDGGRSWIFRPLDPPADLPDIDCKGGNCKYLDTVSVPRFTSPQDGVLLRRVYLKSKVVQDVFLYHHLQNRLPLPIAQYLYYTHDNGKTWIPRPSPVKIGTVYFRDAQVGWLLGKNDPDPASPTQLYHTTDGGETWSQIDANCMLSLGSALQFVDEQTGFAFFPYAFSDIYRYFDVRIDPAARHSYLFYSNDGGSSWVKIEPQVAP